MAHLRLVPALREWRHGRGRRAITRDRHTDDSSIVPQGGTAATNRVSTVPMLFGETKVGKARRLILEPVAESAGIDYYAETIHAFEEDGHRHLRQLGTRHPVTAYRLLSVGCDLLIHLADRDQFPSVSKRGQRKGAKAVSRVLQNEEAQVAASLLAQAQATLAAEQLRLAGEHDSAAVHAKSATVVESFCPLSDAYRSRLSDCSAEYRTLETGDVRAAVREGREIGTGFHQARLDPGHWSHATPEDQQQMVAVQERYAGVYLRRMASYWALELLVGEDMLGACGFERPGMTARYQSVVLDEAEQTLWNILDRRRVAFLRLGLDGKGSGL